MNDVIVTKGDLLLIDFGGSVGSEQSGVRPAICCSGFMKNRFSPVITVIPITSKVKKFLPTHVSLSLKEPSIALAEQATRIDRGRILHKLDQKVTDADMKKIEIAIMVDFGLSDYIPKELLTKKEPAYA